MWQIISAFICQTITTLGCFLFGKIVINEKINISKKKLLFSILIAILINTCVYLNMVGTIKSLFMAIVNIILYNYIFKIFYKKAIILTFIYMIIIFVAEIIQIFSITEILEKSKDFGYSTYGNTIISNIVSFAILLIITFFLKRILKKVVNTRIENNHEIIIFSIMISICVILFFYTILKEFEFNKEVLTYLGAILILVIVLFSLIKQTIENNKLTEQYDKLLEFMKKYEQEAESQRILRHETKNEFLTIKAKLYDKQKNKEVIEYIDEILKDKIELKQEEFAKFVYLPANGIKGLCYFKTQEAKDKGLNTSINISKRVENSNIYKLSVKEQRDLGKILGVFLDNAIEASLNSKAKEFGLEAYLNIKKECEIIISNSYDGELEVDKIGKERFTTKGKNRGHGLLLVNHLVSKNDKFAINTKITNGLYIQTLTIKKITKENEHRK